MLDTLQLEGLLARYTLRHWTADVRAQPERRIRYADEDEALPLLVRLFDADSLPRLRSFLLRVGFDVHVCGSEQDSLLLQVARRIVSGELILEREPIAPMSSDVVEVVAPVPFEPLVNEIYDGVSLKVAPPPVDPVLIAAQARQAKALRAASSTGEPFCEECAKAQVVTQEQLDSQAQQAKVLKTASTTGAPFCELCAACGGPKHAAPSRAELESQAKQTKALLTASSGGKAFCERCTC
jgi:hypothetical protein